MYSILVILAVITAILLILIVLIQESKGGGLTSNMAAGNAILGVNKTTNIVEKITWSLAGALIVISIATVYCTPEVQNSDAIVTEMQMNVPALPSAELPAAAAELPAETAPEAPAN
ncbi:MAG: preprotein translocase subunit SecG [Bacteroidaceae bacterium]|nr:preprotein translocase subunit SecG [Bacteroidaceae bacterium]